MQNIKMLVSKSGSDAGAPPKVYNAGEVYDVSDRLAEVFIGAGMARPTEEETTEAIVAARVAAHDAAKAEQEEDRLSVDEKAEAKAAKVKQAEDDMAEEKMRAAARARKNAGGRDSPMAKTGGKGKTGGKAKSRRRTRSKK